MPLPSVNDVLYDKAQTVAVDGNVVTAMVLDAEIGPTGDAILVSDQQALLDIFTIDGKYKYGMSSGFLEAFNYLGITRPLLIKRIERTGATFGGIALLSSDSEKEYEDCAIANFDPANITWQDDYIGIFAGKNAGDWHGRLIPVIETENQKIENTFTLKIYKDNLNTLIAENVISFEKNLKDGYGVPCYIDIVLNDHNYVQFIWNPTVLASIASGDITELTPKATPTSDPDAENGDPALIFFGASNPGTAPTEADYVGALDAFRNVHKTQFKYIGDAGITSQSFQAALLSLCKGRNDGSYAFLSMPIEHLAGTTKLNDCINYRNTTLAANTYVGEIIGEWIPYLDSFTGENYYLSPSLWVAACCARSANAKGYIQPVFGPTYGVIEVTSDLGLYANWTPEEASILCDNQINPIINDPEAGIIIADQLTLQKQSSPLSERSISNTINLKFRPNLRKLCNGYIGELNNAQLWKRIQENVDGYGRQAYANDEVYDWLAKCDSQNNTRETVRQKKVIVDFAFQATEPTKWITIRNTITPYGADMSELII